MVTNLYDEIIEVLTKHNKTIKDIKWISAQIYTEDEGNMEINKEEFLTLARQIDYDSGYGDIEINPTLQIVGDGWWLERAEYDGSEWFEYQAILQKPDKQCEFNVQDIYWGD